MKKIRKTYLKLDVSVCKYPQWIPGILTIDVYISTWNRGHLGRGFPPKTLGENLSYHLGVGTALENWNWTTLRMHGMLILCQKHTPFVEGLSASPCLRPPPFFLHDVQKCFFAKKKRSKVHIGLEEMEEDESRVRNFASSRWANLLPGLGVGKKTTWSVERWWYIPQQMYVPSRELTYPTWGKGKSSLKCHFGGIC